MNDDTLKIRMTIATKLGWTHIRENNGDEWRMGSGDYDDYQPDLLGVNSDGDDLGLPNWCNDYNDAFCLVKLMEDAGYWVEIRTPFGKGKLNDGYWCGATPHGVTGWNGIPDYHENAESIPLAICKTFLKLMEYKEKWHECCNTR